MNGMAWIRKTYDVPAQRGGRAIYSGSYSEQYGTIVSAKNGRLNIRLDGAKRPSSFHPTWELRYLA